MPKLEDLTVNVALDTSELEKQLKRFADALAKINEIEEEWIDATSMKDHSRGVIYQVSNLGKTRISFIESPDVYYYLKD